MSAIYDRGRQGFLDGSLDWDTHDIKVALVRTSAYTVNLATHEYYDQVNTFTVALSPNLTGKTTTAGVADANDVVFPAVPAGAAINAMVIFRDTGTAGSSRLIAYIDGFTVTPNGADITVTWDNGANKIFKL